VRLDQRPFPRPQPQVLGQHLDDPRVGRIAALLDKRGEHDLLLGLPVLLHEVAQLAVVFLEAVEHGAREHARTLRHTPAALTLTDDIRTAAARVAAAARHVRIREGAIEGYARTIPAVSPLAPDLEGANEETRAAFSLQLNAINFGSGWFPTLRKRPGCSGYYTVSWALADHWRAHGPWSPEELRRMDADLIADVLGQERGHELMGLYAQALRDLGDWLGRNKRCLAPFVTSAEAFAESLREMPFFEDVGFWKRAQITANDFQLAGIADFEDIDRLTIFADNLVPHVLRVDGVLRYDEALAARIDSGELLPPGEEEREIRGCAVYACELIAAELGIPARDLDVMLWNRGQGERYKSRPRHRTRTVYY